MYKQWIELSIPKPVEKYYKVFLKPTGFWGINGLSNNVEAYHETLDAALKAATALEARLSANGSYRTQTRRRRRRY